MEFWHFSEQSMHPAWNEIDGPTKVTVDNRHCDPVVAHELYNRYLDEWIVADELGYNIFVNEHQCLGELHVGLVPADAVDPRAPDEKGATALPRRAGHQPH